MEEAMPVDRCGNCLPWLTYPAIAFLSKRIQRDMAVFEYGSGNSTFWWSQRVARVVACEHDAKWYTSMKERVPSNVDYRHYEREDGKYSRAILEYHREFDVVVIDGRDRVACAKNSLGALREDGAIVWDNSDRERYREGYSYLLEHGFKRLDFEGHGPNETRRWCTSIFYRSNNCFCI
ncbi:class I SAM-dependent methyltransferase [Rubidibacter lacunae]|nr:FkbM family methyltransferase [Rubidibacter lacunae]